MKNLTARQAMSGNSGNLYAFAARRLNSLNFQNQINARTGNAAERRIINNIRLANPGMNRTRESTPITANIKFSVDNLLK